MQESHRGVYCIMQLQRNLQLIEERSFEYSWSNRLLRVNKETESKKHWQFHSCDFTFFLSQCRTLYSNNQGLNQDQTDEEQRLHVS